jgi:putative membrane protein
MNGFLVRTAITALGLLLAAVLVPGIRVAGIFTLVLAAVLFGVVNALVRPALLRLTVPFTGAALPVALLLVNAAMLGFTRCSCPACRCAACWRRCSAPWSSPPSAGGASRFVRDDGRIAADGRGAGTLPPRL